MSRQKGFTLVELMVTLALVSVLIGTAVWQAQRLAPAWRTSAAAARIAADVRRASAIAARTNRPVQMVFEPDSGDGCGFRYEIRGGAASTWERVCLGAEYPGVAIDAKMAEVRCKREEDAGLAALPACSLCAGGTITFYPTGETIASAAGLAGDTLVLVPRDGSKTHARAVGVRTGSGATRTYRPAKGGGWECP